MIANNILEQVELSDSTLREGRQCAGFHMTPADSVEFSKRVAGLCIDYLELTHPASSLVMSNLITKIISLNLMTKVATHVRLNQRDVIAAIKTGVKNINTYVPVDLQAFTSISKREFLIALKEDLYRITNFTKKATVELRVSVEHTFSLPLDLITEIYQIIGSVEGIRRAGIAETTGVSDEDYFEEVLERVYEVLPNWMPLQIHLHNDTGLAAAYFRKTLKIISKNKRRAIFDISVGGVGERNGILSYGDVFANFYLLNRDGLISRYRIGDYAELLNFFVRKTGLTLSYRDPLNRSAFTHSASPHLAKMLTNKSSYQKIDPRDFGFLGPFLNLGHAVTGYKGIQYFAQKHGMTLGDSEAKEIAAVIREYAAVHGPYSSDQLLKVLRQTKNIQAINNFPHFQQ